MLVRLTWEGGGEFWCVVEDLLMSWVNDDQDAEIQEAETEVAMESMELARSMSNMELVGEDSTVTEEALKEVADFFMNRSHPPHKPHVATPHTN